jgi:hypothetical protein
MLRSSVRERRLTHVDFDIYLRPRQGSRGVPFPQAATPLDWAPRRNSARGLSQSGHTHSRGPTEVLGRIPFPRQPHLNMGPAVVHGVMPLPKQPHPYRRPHRGTRDGPFPTAATPPLVGPAVVLGKMPFPKQPHPLMGPHRSTRVETLSPAATPHLKGPRRGSHYGVSHGGHTHSRGPTEVLGTNPFPRQPHLISRAPQRYTA